jgi:hypothetical protein
LTKNLTESEQQDQKRKFFRLIIFTLILFMAIRLPLDSDFWWHIRAGQLSLENKAPVLQDLTSFTAFNSPWINHSWLSQIFYFFLFSVFGNIGVMLGVAILATLSQFFVYRRLKNNEIINGFTILLCVLTTAVVWSPRPQLFSLVLFSILTYLLYEKEIFQNRWILFAIPFLFLIWGNLHAGFSIGILLLGSYIVGLFLDILFSNKKIGKELYTLIVFWIILITICSLIVMINPNGFGIWKVQFSTISIPSLQNLIPEWASPDFHELYQQPFLWLSTLLVFLFMANKSKYSFTVILPFVLLGALGFISRRNYVYFAIFSIPVLSLELQSFYDQYIKELYIYKCWLNNIKKFNKEPNSQFSKIINLIFIGCLWFLTIGKIVYLGSPTIYNYYITKSFPKAASGFLLKNENNNLRCLNSYAWGGYLSWMLPEIKIFIDGRTDLYGEVIIQDWIEMVNGGQKWSEKFDYYNINCVILENNRPIIEKLSAASWKTIYNDDISIVKIKPD